MYEAWGKRAFDIGVAALLLVLLLPAFAAVALAVRWRLGAPVIFMQLRAGRAGRPFRILKFRSMREGPGTDAERLAGFGRALRASGLDELPQLLNVLRGEMSLVGPRPYLPSEIERMGACAETILKARPGLTGLWQVSGRSTLTFEQRLRLDEYYTRNWSLWTDIMVLCHTTGAVWRADGAY